MKLNLKDNSTNALEWRDGNIMAINGNKIYRIVIIFRKQQKKPIFYTSSLQLAFFALRIFFVFSASTSSPTLTRSLFRLGGLRLAATQCLSLATHALQRSARQNSRTLRASVQERQRLLSQPRLFYSMKTWQDKVFLVVVSLFSTSCNFENKDPGKCICFLIENLGSLYL